MLMRSMNETTSRMNRNQMSRRKTLLKTVSSAATSAIMPDCRVAIGASLAGWRAVSRLKAVKACIGEQDPHRDSRAQCSKRNQQRRVAGPIQNRLPHDAPQLSTTEP